MNQLALLPSYTVEVRWPDIGDLWHPCGSVGAPQRLYEREAVAWAARLSAMWAGRAEVRVAEIAPSVARGRTT